MQPPKVFRQTVKIGSASSWDKNILTLFHVKFDSTDLSDLHDFLDAKYFQPPPPDEESSQGILVTRLEATLMVGYYDIIQASEDARGEDFSVLKRHLVRKFRSNPLGPFFCTLSDFLVTHSAEALDMMRSKTRPRSASPKKRARISKQDDVDETSHNIELPSAIAIDPSTPSPSTPVGNKRVFSGGSYGHSSTETTPSKIIHSEPLTQALQNNLVETLIYHVWLGGVETPWAQNREMYMDYRPYHAKIFRI